MLIAREARNDWLDLPGSTRSLCVLRLLRALRVKEPKAQLPGWRERVTRSAIGEPAPSMNTTSPLREASNAGA